MPDKLHRDEQLTHFRWESSRVASLRILSLCLMHSVSILRFLARILLYGLRNMSYQIAFGSFNMHSLKPRKVRLPDLVPLASPILKMELVEGRHPGCFVPNSIVCLCAED